MEQSQRAMTHPDENLLAAFAERTLAGGERERVLAHLSDCPDCREAVFLAQQAVPQLEPQAGLRLGGSERRASRWRWAIVSMAGLFAAILVVAPVSMHRQAENSAKASPAPLAASDRKLAQPPGLAPLAHSSTAPARSSAAGVLGGQRPTPLQSGAHPRAANVAASAQAASPHTVAAAPASVLAALPTAGSGQFGARIAGSVVDSSGGAIPGAIVSLRLPDATTRRAVTGPSGRFDIGAVPPGNYLAEFSAPGFQSATRDVDVQEQGSAVLSQTLAVGATSQTVSVSAAPVQLQTENSEVHGAIDGKEVGSLPLQGRNFTQLAPLTAKQPAQASAGAGAGISFGAGGGLIRPVGRLSIQGGRLQSCVGATCTARVLPSGAPAASVAFDAMTSLVVDADGSLYSTKDLGEHWLAIKTQWQGKAIALEQASPPSGSVKGGSVKGSSVKGADAKQAIGGPVATDPVAGAWAAPSVFALTNDQGQVWLSADEGQTWRLKQHIR